MGPEMFIVVFTRLSRYLCSEPGESSSPLQSHFHKIHINIIIHDCDLDIFNERLTAPESSKILAKHVGRRELSITHV